MQLGWSTIWACWRARGVRVAAEIKRPKPQLPIVMLADDLELPEGALKSVDALVTKSDGAHFLWATVHFVLNVKPTQRMEGTLKVQKAAELRRTDRSREGQRAVSCCRPV